MRADLTTMEQIDLYLQGKMTAAEAQQFEAFLHANPDLKTMVSDQQLLIQTVNRKALLAEIHAVAGIGGTPWYANPFVAVTGAVVAVAAIGTLVYFLSGDTTAEKTLVADETNTEANLEATPENPDGAALDQPVYGDTVLASEHVTPRDRTGHTHPMSGSGQETYLDEPVYFDLNQADQLSVQADDQLEEVDARENKTVEETTTARNRSASYPKGDLAMKAFIAENMRFPGTAREKKISGNVKVKFLVTPEGTRSNIEATCFNLRDENDKPLSTTQVMLNQKIANLFEREAARVVRIMPVWLPATDSQGNAVLAPAELYFNFSLTEGNSVYRID